MASRRHIVYTVLPIDQSNKVITSYEFLGVYYTKCYTKISLMNQILLL